MKTRKISTVLALIICSLQLSATKYYVNDASLSGDIYCSAIGNGANNGLSSASPKLTLTSVLTTYAASFAAGDTIFIDAGNYTEIQLSSPINGVVIKGAGLLKTVITKLGSDRYFMLINDNNTIVSDIKLSGYDNQSVSGVQALGVAANTIGVKIINVQVDGCATSSTTGGYPIEIASGASVQLIGGGVTCNSWDAGGGIQISGATTNVTIRNYQFIGNYQLSDNGTALKINNGIVNVYNSRFESNTIGSDLSGMGIDVALGTVNVYDCYFYKNQSNILSNNIGGAVSIHGGTFKITRSVFSGNVPEPATSGIYGAAIGVTGGTVTIDSCGFTGNVGARANDVYVKAGTVLSYNCTFNSAANQIGIAGGTFSISTCGTPGEYGAGINHLNTNAPTYTANPILPDYLPVSCVAIACTTPTITSSVPTNTICSGSTFSTNLSASTTSAQTTYSWSSTAVIGITGHATTGAGNIHETLTNTSSSTLTVTYSVTPVFNLTCLGSVVVYSVSVYPTNTISVSSSTICTGDTATVTPTGASSYTIQPGSVTGTTFTLNPINTTTYAVSGNSSNSCSTPISTFTITVNSLPTLTLTASSSTLCNGFTSTLTATGATSFTWTPAGSLSSVNGLTVTATPTATTVYTVTGTDANGCKNNQITTVNVTPLPNLTFTAAPSSLCSGLSSTLTASGADTYTWSPAGDLNTNTGSVVVSTPSASAVYTVVATFTATGCVNTGTVGITVTASPSLTILPSSTYTLCKGDSTELSVTGGTTYTWTALPAGSLSSVNGASVTVTPTTSTIYSVSGIAGGCASSTASATVIVNTPPDISAHALPTNICIGGSSTLSATGLAISYTWTPSATLNTPNGTPVIASPTVTTEYIVTGTGANGCTAKDSVKVTVNPTPTVSISSGGGGSSQSVCVGATVNTITFNSAPGTYINWTNTNTNIGIAASGTTSIASYTAPVVATQQTGTITAIATDSTTGCSSAIILPPVYVVTINPLPIISASDSLTPGGCGGLANGCISHVAGQAPGVYQYSWDNGVTWSGNSQNCNIPAGNYVVEVQDANGCISPKTISLPTANAPANPTVAGNPTSTCAGDTIHLSVTNPQAHMTYTWTTSAGTQTGTTYTINNVNPSGTYTVGLAIADSNACSNDTSFSFVVNAPPQPIISGSNHFCKGTSTTLNVTPTGTNFVYQWNLAGVAIGGATASSYTATTGGTFGVAVTNTLTGCKHDTLITITIDSVPPAPSITTSTNNNTYCQGSTINPITVTGTGTFIWYSDAGLTTQIGTGSPFTPSVTATSTLYVTASNSVCTSDSTPVVITINPTPPTPTITVGAGNNVYCQNQTIGTIIASGPSTIVWYDNAGLTPPSINTGNSYTPSGLLPNTTTTYYLIDTSAAGCKSPGTATVSVTINATPNTPLVTSPTATAYCQGVQPGTITASGASTIVWYDNAGLTNVVNTGNSYTPTGLPVGTTTYYLVDSSAAGCKSAGSATVSVTINATPTTPTVTSGNAAAQYCQGSSINPVTVSGNGTVVWYNNAALTPPAIATGNTYAPGNLSLGTTTYYLIDTSAAGCKSSGTATVSITINPNPVVTGTASIGSYTCGLNNGSVLGLTAIGGTSPYQYQWVDASGATVGTAANLTNVGAGTYSLIVIDANQCQATSNGTGYVVGGSSAVTAAFTASTYQGTAPLAVTFSNTSTPTGTITSSWNFGDNTNTTSNTSTQTNPAYTYTNAGTYVVTLVASNGTCNEVATATITVDAPEILIIPNIFSPNGDGVNDQFFINSSGLSTLTCDIYNRWGQLIFSIKSINQTWDGVMNNGNHASEGTYFYLLQATGLDGKEYKKDGPLTLLR